MQQSAAMFSGADTGDRADGAVRGGEVAPWVLALLLAGVGTAIDFDAQPGINWGIWTTMASGGLLWIARRRGRALGRETGRGAPVDPVAVWAALLAIPVAWGAAVTANDLFQFFILVTCAALLAVATRVIGGVPGNDVGIEVVAAAPFAACAASTMEAGRRTVGAITRARDERRKAAVRGVLLAVPVALLFALVLAGADPVLTAWLEELWNGMAEVVTRVVFFVGLGTLALGAYGLAARAADQRPMPRSVVGRGSLGASERRAIVGGVAGVFGAFLALQTTYLFRDVDALRVSGVTYAEYARAGFAELTVAATLAVGLIVALDRYGALAARESSAANRWQYWGTLVLIAEVLIVLVSAFHRLMLYESAYGFTMLRLYVQAYEVGIAITLVILAIEVAQPAAGFDARRAARRTGVVAVGFLLVFSFANPEAWVVRQDVARFYVTGKLDTPYLAYLSLNAVPSLVDAMATLPPVCAGYVHQDLSAEHLELTRHGEPGHWYEWNLRRARGLAALRGAGVHLPAVQEMGGCYPGERPASP